MSNNITRLQRTLPIALIVAMFPAGRCITMGKCPVHNTVSDSEQILVLTPSKLAGGDKSGSFARIL